MTATDDRRRVRPFGPGGYDRGAEPALPPGPRWPALVQSVALLRFRHRFVPAMHRRYGEVFTIRLPPSGQPLVIFTRPSHIKEIFAGDAEVFEPLVQGLERSEVRGYGPDGEVARYAHTVLILPTVLGFAFALC